MPVKDHRSQVKTGKVTKPGMVTRRKADMNGSSCSDNDFDSSCSDSSLNCSDSRESRRVTLSTSSNVSQNSPALNNSRLSFNDESRLDKSFESSPSRSRSLYPMLTEDQCTQGRDEKVYHAPRNRLYPDLKEMSPKLETHDNRKRKKTETLQKSNESFYIFVLALIVIIIITACLLSSSSEPTKAGSASSSFQQFVHDLSSMESKFPGQNRRLWKTFRASSKHVLDTAESQYPSVILMVSQFKDSEVAACIAKKITSSFGSSVGQGSSVAWVDVKEFAGIKSVEEKRKLDEEFMSTFQSGGKAVVVDSLELLSADAALLLHGYCDGDNAPYKDVMMVLLLHVDPNEVAVDLGQSYHVEKYLESLWGSQLDMDKVGALLSRVANNIVIVGEETESTLANECL